MKKYIYILIVILFAAYLGFFLLNSKGEYRAEKLFYSAAQIKDKIASNPDVIPPALFSSAEKKLKTICEKYPKSKLAMPSRIMLIELYTLNKEHDKAIAVLDTILDTPKQSRDVLSNAHFAKGNIYEKQEKWDDALAQYQLLRNELNDTLHGLQMPLYIGDFHSRIKKQAQANEAYDNAVVFYKKIAVEDKGKVLGYMASALLEESYMRLGKFEEAGKAAQDTLNNYASSLTYMQYLPKIDFIYVKTLNNPSKAVDIYKGIMHKTNDPKLKKQLAKRIENLNFSLTQ